MSASKSSSSRSSGEDSRRPALPIAVIDIGSTAVRMAVAQVNPDGSLRTLESLCQEVSLGTDSFTKGMIERPSIEECVRALRSFRRVLAEYDIADSKQVRAVATSAVREARNRDAFIDRIYSATGIDVRVIDEAEVSRYTYLSVRPDIEKSAVLRASDTLVIEVGGGSTEVLVVQRGRLVFSYSYRLGSYRMRETLEEYGAADVGLLTAMENRIQRTVGHIRQRASVKDKPNMLALGGDIRFAATHLLPNWEGSDVARLPLRSLSRFTNKLLKLSVDELVHRYHLPYPDAEALGPALLTYVHVARALKLKYILVSASTMREGIQREMVAGDIWTGELEDQIVHSAVELGRRYEYDESHAQHVAKLSCQLFDGMQEEHMLGRRYRLILRIAALLHEIGLFISNRSHHKHSFYLIRNSSLFGLSDHDLLLTALVARYHRRALPKPSHAEFGTLERDDRIAVTKMAAILRVADALDRGHTQRIRTIGVERIDGHAVITANNVAELSLEQLALREKGDMFEYVYGMDVALRGVAAGDGNA